MLILESPTPGVCCRARAFNAFSKSLEGGERLPVLELGVLRVHVDDFHPRVGMRSCVKTGSGTHGTHRPAQLSPRGCAELPCPWGLFPPEMRGQSCIPTHLEGGMLGLMLGTRVPNVHHASSPRPWQLGRALPWGARWQLPRVTTWSPPCRARWPVRPHLLLTPTVA